MKMKIFKRLAILFTVLTVAFASGVNASASESGAAGDAFAEIHTYADMEALQVELTAREAEISDLEARLAEAEGTLADLEARLEAEMDANQKTVAEKDAEISALKAEQDRENGKFQNSVAVVFVLGLALIFSVPVTCLLCWIWRKMGTNV